MRRIIPLALSLCLLLTSCGLTTGGVSPTPSPSIAPTHTRQSLPDLVVKSMSIELQDESRCSDFTAELGVRVWVENVGKVPAGSFVVEMNGTWLNLERTLASGESTSLWFPGYTLENRARLDATYEVEEENENNNQTNRILPVPTPPAACIPTPLPVADIDQPLDILKGHTAKIWSLDFSPDGRLLASASVDNTLRLWQVQQRDLLRTMQGHPFPVLSVDFSPSGQVLATGSDDGLVRIWEVVNGQLLHALQGHAGWVRTVTFSPDARLLASGSDDFTVRLWRVTDGEPVQTIDEGMTAITSLAFSPDGRLLGWAETDGSLRLWEISSQKWLLIVTGSGQPAKSVAFSPDGTLLAAGYSDGSVRIYSLVTGSAGENGPVEASLLHTLRGHTGPVNSLAFSPDGNHLASGSDDATLILWQMPDANPRYIYKGHAGPVNSVTFSPDGALLASGSSDATIRLWPVEVDE